MRRSFAGATPPIYRFGIWSAMLLPMAEPGYDAMLGRLCCELNGTVLCKRGRALYAVAHFISIFLLRDVCRIEPPQPYRKSMVLRLGFTCKNFLHVTLSSRPEHDSRKS